MTGQTGHVPSPYGISYPTVRLRLDRLIAKIKVYDSEHKMSAFERTVRALHADGRIDVQTLKTLLAAHQNELEAIHESAVANRPGSVAR